MVNYANGKIYTIRSYIRPDLIYVGSTVQLLKERLRHHKKDYKRWSEGKHSYTTSYKIIELGDAYIELYAKCPCNDREELFKHEGEVIRELDCVNKHIPGRTKKEWREDNKEAILEWQKQYDDGHKEQKKKYQQENKETIAEKAKQYREENKEEILEYQKQYYDENKERVKEQHKQYREANKEALLEKAKQYYEENKEAIAGYQKQYREVNKEKIAEKKKQKYTCECGSVIQISDKSKHFKTKKHKNFINSNITDINVV